MPLIRKGFLEISFHFFGTEIPDDADTAVVNIYQLMPFPVKVSRRMDYDSVNEFMDQFRRKLLGLVWKSISGLYLFCWLVNSGNILATKKTGSQFPMKNIDLSMD